MKTIKNIISIFVFAIIVFFSVDDVFAASASISVKGNKKTAVVGDTIKVTFTVSSNSNKVPLGSWEFDVKYDTDKLTLVSSTLESKTRSNGVVYNSETFDKKYTITFKAKKAGTAKVYVTNSLVVDYKDEKPMSTTDGSATINIITQEELEASYSKDNYLSSLSISGYDLTPKFDKNTTEYSLELENNVREIKVSAKANDSKAEVEGTGKHSLNEGQNKITISVTAENGNVRNYVINVLVKELNPINVTVDGNDYTVVRKASEITPPITFSSTTVVIEGEEVPAFESDITGYLLVALKDSNGDIKFFIYENDKYTLYEERVFNSTTLYMIEPEDKDIPEGYELTNMSISGIPTDAYKSEDNEYPLLYGVNVQTGKTNWYSYDEEEMTLQRYVSPSVKEVDNTKYLIVIGVLGGTSLLLLIVLLLLNSKLRKHTIKKVT